MKALNPSKLWKKRLGDWVINPYVGCEHGCFHCYCPAMPGVRFNNHGHTQVQWGKYLYPKVGIVEALEKELLRFTPDTAKRTEWGNGWILMSFLTDCYTPQESKQKLTRRSLQLLLEAGHRVRIQTRSSLVERDFDILAAHRDQVLLGTSLPYLDDSLSRILEPKASSPSRRLLTLQRAKELDIPLYVAIAPFLPFHSVETLDEVLERVLPLNPKEVFCEVLNPKGDNLEMMRKALADEYPHHAIAIASYSAKSWANFTWHLLNYGHQRSSTFVPWPDSKRTWRNYISQEQSEFLENFLPRAEQDSAGTKSTRTKFRASDNASS
jgi:DNA repair photolyase